MKSGILCSLKAPSRACLAIVLLAVCSVGIVLPSCSGKQLTTEQKLEDFRYLFNLMRENHPYLALKARTEGYDWLAHEREFEEAIRRTKNDAEFAREIARILLLINDGHTTIVFPQLYEMITSMPEELRPWLEEAAKTDAETVKRWSELAFGGLMPKKFLPFLALYVRGEYYVVSANEEAKAKGISPGQKVLSINNIPVHDFVAGLRGAFRLPYDPIRKRVYMHQLVVSDTSRTYDVVLKNPDGTCTRARVELVKTLHGLVSPVFPTNLPRKTSNIYTGYLADGKVAYVHISRMAQYEASEHERTVLKRFFAEIEDVPALIIDIRGNGGGDDRFWMLNIVRPLATRPLQCSAGGAARSGSYGARFREANAEFASRIEGFYHEEIVVVDKNALSRYLTPAQVANLPPEILTEDFDHIVKGTGTLNPSGETPYHGRVFLVVDRFVFSSAEGFAAFCKGSGWATLVGEPTGGGGDGSGPVIAVLPNSKMAVFFPCSMGLNPDFTANAETHTTPDVLVEPDPQDVVRCAEALVRGWSPGESPNLEYDTVLRECVSLALGGE